VAVTTAMRMVANLHSNPQDVKLRSIRVSNKAFQSKVACVPGGVDLLQAAGYCYTSPPGATEAGSDAGANDGAETPKGGAEDLYLVHAMDAPGVRRLRYTLLRCVDCLRVCSTRSLSRYVTMCLNVCTIGCRSCLGPVAMEAILRHPGGRRRSQKPRGCNVPLIGCYILVRNGGLTTFTVLLLNPFLSLQEVWNEGLCSMCTENHP
jgi:hypothetical protein